MAKPNSHLIRVDPKLTAELRKIQEQMRKDLGVKISTAQASKIFVHEKQLKQNSKIRF